MLHVATSTDARFAADCAVLLGSLMSTHEPAAVQIHLLHDDSLSADDLAALRSIVVDAGGRFDAIGELDRRAAALAQSDRFPLRIWYRVLLPELLPELERVLYIDADALVAAPLDELWERDLSSALVGAVTNPLYSSMVPRIVSDLGLPDAASYFNSGVLLIDLEAWRAAGTSRSVFDFARTHAIAWPDQDALNGVLHDRRLPLHPRWNAMPGVWELPRRYLPYTDDEVSEAAAHPAIVHFVGPYKPWHYRSRHRYRSLYFRHLEATPWRGRPIEGRSAWHAFLRRLPMVWAHRIEIAAAERRSRVSTR